MGIKVRVKTIDHESRGQLLHLDDGTEKRRVRLGRVYGQPEMSRRMRLIVHFEEWEIVRMVKTKGSMPRAGGHNEVSRLIAVI